MLNKLSIRDINPENKKVFIRVDFNVPLNEELDITDDFRIRRGLKSIEYLLEKGAAVIVASHLGRPKGKIIPEMSLKPVFEHLNGLLGKEVMFAPDCVGEEVRRLADHLRPGEVLLLENLRFNKQETANGSELSSQLASLATVYVNDAFGTAHRAHASTVGMAAYFSQAVAGLLMIRELEYLGNALAKPEKPFTVILGGVKVSWKINVINNLLDKCDYILIGGAMAYTFMKAGGIPVGSSLIEDDKLKQAEGILNEAEKRGVKLLLPQDHICAKDIKKEESIEIIGKGEKIPDGLMGMDIGELTASEYSRIISNSKTIVWNGPMGLFEVPYFAESTMKIARAIADSDAVSIIGGGDTASAVKAAGVADKINHVSTGGGASLAFFAGKELPAITALTDK